jgi:pimeloyl-[acyl-carrier protein] methyl ester esterase
LKLLLTTDLRSALPRIRQDTLVVHGERDTLSPLAAGKYLAEALPRGRLAVILAAAHAPFVSDPAAVSRSMLEFLNEP